MSKSSRPPSIGVLGGGQLGRMLALEARRMGIRIVSWTGTREPGPAALADTALTETFSSSVGLESFVRGVDVATVEFENIPRNLLESLEKEIRLAPSAEAVGICQHREREKRFLADNGFPCPHHTIVDSAMALGKALANLPADHGILKTAEFGYDGKGQQVVHRNDNPEAIWAAFDAKRAVLEERVPLEGELSVLVVRDANGEMACYEPAENFHRDHILDVSIIPARYPQSLLEEARDIAQGIAEAMAYQGIMAIEFFLSKGGKLLVNELAPRPHNSGHHTLDACQTSQFEQQLRVALELPIGGTQSLVPSVMCNLLGDLWPSATVPPSWDPVLRTPGAKLHLYGKAEARVGRKMGHITFTAPTIDQALEHAQCCRQSLGLPNWQ